MVELVRIAGSLSQLVVRIASCFHAFLLVERIASYVDMVIIKTLYVISLDLKIFPTGILGKASGKSYLNWNTML